MDDVEFDHSSFLPTIEIEDKFQTYGISMYGIFIPYVLEVKHSEPLNIFEGNPNGNAMIPTEAASKAGPAALEEQEKRRKGRYYAS